MALHHCHVQADPAKQRGAVEAGQEPSATHDMDDDDIEDVEEAETSSDQSN